MSEEYHDPYQEIMGPTKADEEMLVDIKMSEPALYKYPRVMRVCQNCEYADNKKGKFFQDGWNIWCNNETRWFRWDKRKRCYTHPTKKEA